MANADAFKQVGISYRQLDVWTTKGYLQARPRGKGVGSGVPRSWPTAELEVARRMKQLLDSGFVLQKAAQFARFEPGDYHLAPGVKLVLGP